MPFRIASSLWGRRDRGAHAAGGGADLEGRGLMPLPTPKLSAEGKRGCQCCVVVVTSPRAAFPGIYDLMNNRDPPNNVHIGHSFRSFLASCVHTAPIIWGLSSTIQPRYSLDNLY
jgi:hypothetical protein